MSWQSLWRAVTRHRELALGVTFVGVAGWELIEYLALERANGNGPLPLTLHAVPVLEIARPADCTGLQADEGVGNLEGGTG